MGMFLRRGIAPKRTRMSDLEIGRTIKLNLNGTPWEWLVVHQGLPSAIYDASCDGTWLLLKDIYEERQWHSSNVNDYANSTIHSYQSSTFLALFDSNIQSAIKQGKIPYVNGVGGSDVDSGTNGLPAKAFLLSGSEVGISISDASSMAVVGAKLDYFESGTGTSALNKRVAYLNGSTTGWWLRVPAKSNKTNAWEIRANGKPSVAERVGTALGIRPAIIIDPDFIVTDDMLA